MKQCLIYNCVRSEDRPCCAECGVRDCEDRCLNAPERCRAWYEPPPEGRIGPGQKFDHGQILALYLSGLDQRSVAECMGCDPSSVGAVLRKYGVHIRGKISGELAALMYRSGTPKKKIAEAMGVSPSTVANAISGWERRHGKG